MHIIVHNETKQHKQLKISVIQDSCDMYIKH